MRAIVLIGPPGSGKTSAGQILAQRLNWTFKDTDRLIEERYGRSVSSIFAEQGENAFRALETEQIERIAADEELRHCLVLATGGGIAVTPGNYEILSRIGIVVCLRASVAALTARLAEDKTRPLLASSDPEQSAEEALRNRLHSLLEARSGAYSRASYAVDTSTLLPEEVAIQVEKVFLESKQ